MSFRSGQHTPGKGFWVGSYKVTGGLPAIVGDDEAELEFELK